MSPRGQHRNLEALLAVQRWDDVISMASTALATDPQDAWLYALLAAAQLGAGRPAEALEAADNAARLAPELEWAHRLRARALADLGRHAKALEAAREAVRLEPQSRDALQTLASQQLALKRLADAETTVAELIKIAPEWAESFNTRGRLFLRKRKFGEAETDFRAALRIAPDEPAYMNNLGAALQARGQRKEAIDAFRNAATTDPNFATARKNLSASTGRYLWGGALVVVLSIALRAFFLDSLGHTNSRATTLVVLLILLAVFVPVILVRYWLRKRSLHPVVQTFYDVEARRAWRRPDAQAMVRVGGFLLLLAVFVAAMLTNEIQLAGFSSLLAIIWLYRGATIWRYASRWFSR